MVMNKNVLYVIPSLGHGGAELQTINQLNFLYKHGYENFYLLVLTVIHDNLTINIPPKNVFVLNQNKTKRLTIQGIRNSFRLTSTFNKIINDHNIDIVLAILPLPHFILRITKFVRKFTFQKKIVSINYHRSMQYNSNPLNTSSKYLFNKINSFLAYLFDSKNIFISQAVKKDIQDNFFIRNPSVIYNSVPKLSVDGQAGQEYLQKIVPDNKFIILIPGRLVEEKGHFFMFNTLRKMIDRNLLNPQNISILVAGKGPLKSEIEDNIRKNKLEEIVLMLGMIKNDLLLSLFKKCDLVLIPSINEGFGNVTIECLMQKAIVLSSNAGGLDEIIMHEENGYKFESENENDLIEKFLAIYNGKAKPLNKENLYNDYINRFTLESQIEKLLEILNITS